MWEDNEVPSCEMSKMHWTAAAFDDKVDSACDGAQKAFKLNLDIRKRREDSSPYKLQGVAQLEERLARDQEAVRAGLTTLTKNKKVQL